MRTLDVFLALAVAVIAALVLFTGCAGAPEPQGDLCPYHKEHGRADWALQLFRDACDGGDADACDALTQWGAYR